MKDKNIIIDDKSLNENKGGFQMPENYLKDFGSKMLHKIEEEPIQNKHKLFRLNSVYMALVPIAAVLILGFFLFVNNSNDTDYDLFNSELSWDEYASFDESWIVDELMIFEDEPISNYDMEVDFLIDEGITTNEIIEVFKELP